MKKWVSIGAATLLASFARAGDVTVQVTKVPKAEGTIIATLMNTDEAWNQKAAPLQEVRVPAVKGTTELRFADVAPGVYAVFIHHDANANGKFDTNFMGIPKEGWGYSRNANPMRRVRFDEARFALEQAAMTLEIILR